MAQLRFLRILDRCRSLLGGRGESPVREREGRPSSDGQPAANAAHRAGPSRHPDTGRPIVVDFSKTLAERGGVPGLSAAELSEILQGYTEQGYEISVHVVSEGIKLVIDGNVNGEEWQIQALGRIDRPITRDVFTELVDTVIDAVEKKVREVAAND